jgi:excisionase family DNA binding protein
MEGEDFYTVEEAAKVLQFTPGRIRQMLRAGSLGARKGKLNAATHLRAAAPS